MTKKFTRAAMAAVLVVSAGMAGATGAMAQGNQPTLQSMLGAQVAFLESRFGPARTVDRDQRTYVIGACEASVTTSGDEVVGYAVPLTRACSTHAYAALQAYELPRKLNLTLGEFARIRDNVRFKADCLSLCGNAADPWVYFESQGLRGQEGIRAGTILVDGGAIDASDRIENAIKAAHGEDYVIDTKFNCTTEFDAVAVRELDRVAITEIAVGAAPLNDCL